MTLSLWADPPVQQLHRRRGSDDPRAALGACSTPTQTGARTVVGLHDARKPEGFMSSASATMGTPFVQVRSARTSFGVERELCRVAATGDEVLNDPTNAGIASFPIDNPFRFRDKPMAGRSVDLGRIRIRIRI